MKKILLLTLIIKAQLTFAVIQTLTTAGSQKAWERYAGVNLSLYQSPYKTADLDFYYDKNYKSYNLRFLIGFSKINELKLEAYAKTDASPYIGQYVRNLKLPIDTALRTGLLYKREFSKSPRNHSNS